MKKILLISALVLSLSSNAFATGNHNPPKDPPKTPPSHTTTNNNHNSASANAAAAAISGSRSNASVGNVSATGGDASIAAGAVKNENSLSQQQQQQQGQQQSVSNSGNSSIEAGAVVGGDTSSSASADNNGNNSNNTNVNFEARRIPVSTAYAAGLTSGADTCLGSASGGVQTGIVGVSFGSTKVDKNCVNIKNTHLIAEFSPAAGCAYMLKNVKGASEAFKEVGATCMPPPVVETAPVIVAPVVDPVPAPNYVTREELNEHEKRIITKILSK